MNSEQNPETRTQNAGSTAPCLNDFFGPSDAAPPPRAAYDFFGNSELLVSEMDR